MKFLSRFFGEKKEPEYTSRTVDGPRPDGTWTTELSKDGKPYAQVEVGSISALIERSRRSR